MSKWQLLLTAHPPAPISDCTCDAHGCSNHSNLEMEAEYLTKTLSYLNLNISRTKNGRKKCEILAFKSLLQEIQLKNLTSRKIF